MKLFHSHINMWRYNGCNVKKINNFVSCNNAMPVSDLYSEILSSANELPAGIYSGVIRLEAFKYSNSPRPEYDAIIGINLVSPNATELDSMKVSDLVLGYEKKTSEEQLRLVTLFNQLMQNQKALASPPKPLVAVN